MIIRGLADRSPNTNTASVDILPVGVGAGISAGLLVGAFVKLTKEMVEVKARKAGATDPSEKNIEDRNIYFIKNMTLNIISTMTTLGLYYYGNPFRTKPAAVIGGIPVGTVEELSHAMSDLLMKYRSDGGVFLAHQPGGTQTLRIKLKAFGKNRYVILTMIELLALYGSATVVDLYKYIVTSGSDSITPTPEIDTWETFEFNALDQGLEDHHLTFPVITRNKIYLNMYIETYSVREYIELGLNMLEITLFFRKYHIPHHRKYKAVVDERTGKYLYYFNSDYSQTTVGKLRKLDMGLELGLSTALLLYRMLTIISGNSIERNVAVVSALDLNIAYNGETSYDQVLIDTMRELTSKDSLLGYSTANKEELVGLE